MIKKVDLREQNYSKTIDLPLSKSLLNRALILQANYNNITVPISTNVDDVAALKMAIANAHGEINIGAAGTAMRFTTAYFATKPGCNVVLTGSARMLERPIKSLVDALINLGADIEYLNETGHPPLKINGKKLQGGFLEVEANESSQFTTALMLVGPTLTKGLKLKLKSKIVSRPYIKMTASLMQQLGFSVLFDDENIEIKKQESIADVHFLPEPDWSAAAYWYGLVALNKEAKVLLKGLKKESVQGDARVARIFTELGVRTTYTDDGAWLENAPCLKPGKLVINLQNTPDLAQPIVVTCAALGIGVDFHGLETLLLKETNRLEALQTELAKVGCNVAITESTLKFEPTILHPPKAFFCTYKDHRMAMSLALLGCCFPVEIEDPACVSKSYPNFWEDLC